MVGLLIISHYGLAREFRIALEHIVGAQPRFGTLSIMPEDTVDSRMPDLLEAIARVDGGRGVLLLTDIFGATPSNIALSVMDHDIAVEVVAGLNLPMLVKLASARRGSSLEKLVSLAEISGRKHICSGHDMVCRYPRKAKLPS